MVKLTHPPFNEWLLSGELLTPEQNTILLEHLRDCPECTRLQAAWSEVQLQFRSAGQVSPVSGFTNRWQQRLARQQAKRQRRNGWIMFLGTACMALLILVLVVWQIVGVFQSPAPILSDLVYLWTFGFVFAQRLTDIFGTTAHFLPSITLFGLVFFIGFCTLMSVLWLVTYRQLTNVRRVTSW